MKILQYVYPCNSLLTVEHILISCIDFDIIRQNFYTASNLKDLFHNIHPKRIRFHLTMRLKPKGIKLNGRVWGERPSPLGEGLGPGSGLWRSLANKRPEPKLPQFNLFKSCNGKM